MVAGDRDRERAVAALREHYVGGRLTVEDLARRTERALAARSRHDLRRALRGLPRFPDGESVARVAARGAVLVVFTGAYLLFSFVLLLVLGLTLLIHGASGTELLGFLAVWLVPTYLLSRLWRKEMR
jgi:hypothetical protein